MTLLIHPNPRRFQLSHFRLDPAKLAVARTEQAKTNALLDAVFDNESEDVESELDAIDGSATVAFADKLNNWIDRFNSSNREVDPTCPTCGVTAGHDPECREQSFNDLWRTTGNRLA